MEAEIPTSSQCSMCNKPTTMRCGSCNSSRYCSPECQTVDWPIHKILCREFSAFATPPAGCFRRGILFPVDEEKPRFVWVPCIVRAGEECLRSAMTLGFGNSMISHHTVHENLARCRNLANTLAVITEVDSALDGSATNISIHTLMKGHIPSDWCGSVLLVKRVGAEGSPHRFQDVDMVDLRDVVDHFSTAIFDTGRGTLARVWTADPDATYSHGLWKTFGGPGASFGNW